MSDAYGYYALQISIFKKSSFFLEMTKPGCLVFRPCMHPLHSITAFVEFNSTCQCHILWDLGKKKGNIKCLHYHLQYDERNT